MHTERMILTLVVLLALLAACGTIKASIENPTVSNGDDVKTSEAPETAVTTNGIWNIETVAQTSSSDSPHAGLLDPSMALDSKDNPHICYYDSYDGVHGELKYARWTGSSWAIETVDPNGGNYPSLALDSADRPHISYYAGPEGALKYAYQEKGGGWIVKTIRDIGDVYGSSLKLDSGDRPHIAYPDRDNGILRYDYWTGSDWVSDEVDHREEDTESFASRASLALDGKDEPHIVYTADFTLRYAYRAEGRWVIEEIGSGLDDSLSLALDSEGHPHIAYYEGSSKVLRYFYWLGDRWEIETISAGPLFNNGVVSLALDGEGHPHIGYFDAHTGHSDTMTGESKYTRRIEGNWITTTVDKLPADAIGTGTSLALSSDGRPFIAYCDISHRTLKLAQLSHSSPR